METSASPLTIQIPNQLRQEILWIARQNGISMNQVILDCLNRYIENETRNLWSKGFDNLGEDRELSNVEPYFFAQSEMVDHE